MSDHDPLAWSASVLRALGYETDPPSEREPWAYRKPGRPGWDVVLNLTADDQLGFLLGQARERWPEGTISVTAVGENRPGRPACNAEIWKSSREWADDYVADAQALEVEGTPSRALGEAILKAAEAEERV